MRALVLLVALVVSACSGVAPLPPRAQELNRAGVEALAEGDLETADARFELALEYHPRFVDALVNLALVELQRGNFARARRLLARARRLNPDVAQPHHGLGVLEEREGRPEIAAGHYRAALAIDPGFAPARANLARLLFQARDLEGARVQLRRLTEVAPGEPAGFVGLVECLVQAGRADEADAALAEGLRRHPAEGRLVVLDARRLLRAGELVAARRRLEPLLGGRDAVAVEALAFAAAAALAAGDVSAGRALSERALGLDPAHPVALRMRELAAASPP